MEDYPKDVVEEFIDRIINAYNSVPNPGIIGAEKVIELAKFNGQKTLAEKILPIIQEINKSRPWALTEYSKKQILTELGYQ